MPIVTARARRTPGVASSEVRGGDQRESHVQVSRTDHHGALRRAHGFERLEGTTRDPGLGQQRRATVGIGCPYTMPPTPALISNFEQLTQGWCVQ